MRAPLFLILVITDQAVSSLKTYTCCFGRSDDNTTLKLSCDVFALLRQTLKLKEVLRILSIYKIISIGQYRRVFNFIFLSYPH